MIWWINGVRSGRVGDNSEENSWSFKKPIISGLLLPDLLPDPEGGLILVGGLTSNYSKFQIYLS